MNESDNQLSHPKSSGYSYSKLFLGVDQIAHNYILGLSEDIFDYIYRHTQGRPRDIMHICDSLTRLIRTNYNENDFRRLVNESALTILETYLTESRESIHDIDFDQTLNLFTFFKSNILKFRDIERACKHFNETNELITQCNGNCKNCVGTHIISKLYNLGLIGVISKRDYKNIITYSDINRRVFDVDRTIIPISEYYFLHPSVAYYSRRANLERGLEFRNSKITVVANNIEITEYNMFLIEEEMGEKTSREGVFLASTHEDLRDIRSAISDYFEKIGKKITVVENTLSTENINQVHVQDHCLNLVKMSEKIIYVLAKNYGNTYVADKYKRLHNQFVEDSKIQHVSMPVMELLTAFHFNLKHEIYVDERLMFERECYNKNRHLDYIPHFADSNNVFEFLNYLSLKGINLIRFKDLEELKKLVFSNNKQIMV